MRFRSRQRSGILRADVVIAAVVRGAGDVARERIDAGEVRDRRVCWRRRTISCSISCEQTSSTSLQELPSRLRDDAADQRGSVAREQVAELLFGVRFVGRRQERLEHRVHAPAYRAVAREDESRPVERMRESAGPQDRDRGGLQRARFRDAAAARSIADGRRSSSAVELAESTRHWLTSVAGDPATNTAHIKPSMPSPGADPAARGLAGGQDTRSAAAARS